MGNVVCESEASAIRQSAFRALDALKRGYDRAGCWPGRLSSSPFASALALATLSQRRNRDASLQIPIDQGYEWLSACQNEDGGWSDTAGGSSSLRTTCLALSALILREEGKRDQRALQRGLDYWHASGGLDALVSFYGRDYTFLVPILTVGAMSGLIPWKQIPRLPVEALLLPRWAWKLFRLPMVSFALPMFISIGMFRQARASVLPPGIKRKGMRLLSELQPDHGGYLECPVASSFVLLALEGLGYGESSVASKTASFLAATQRGDGSWPIVTELTVWNTILVLRALKSLKYDGPEERTARRWLVGQSKDLEGGFAWQWTPGPGGIPETDDTSLAMAVLADRPDPATSLRLAGAYRWLENLQNRDGGWPTFSRGSGKLPYDRSGVDLTAHVVEGLLAAGADEQSRAVQRGISFLVSKQKPEGCWESLWFGNPQSDLEKNKTHGTGQVLCLFQILEKPPEEARRRGVDWLLMNQNSDGGWGARKGIRSSAEETALSISGLLAGGLPWFHSALREGVRWLVENQESHGSWRPTSIGLYYEALKYEESIYPLAFGLKSLGEYLECSCAG